MRKALLATASGAALLAAGPALADGMADKVHIGLSGYMEQWVGGTDIEEDIRPTVRKAGKDVLTNDSVFDLQSDSEINFTGSIQSDIGLTFGVKVELEADANGAGTHIDESVATVKGGFGTFHIGAEDGAQPTMHYGVPDVGIGLNAGDVGNWIAPINASWSTSLWSAGNDQARLIYYSPRINGVQLGVSYAPDMASGESSKLAPDNEDTETSIAVNFDQAVGDAHLKASVGYSITTTDSMALHTDGDMAAGADVVARKSHGDTADFNIGGQVSMSGFTVAAAYSEVDAEQYTQNGRANDTPVFAEDRKADVEVMALGVSYADGPMALSASWSEQQRGGGGADTATAVMLSASYLLAPGVEIKSSLFTAEDETSTVLTSYGANNVLGGTGADADTMSAVEGTAFVVGLKIGF